MLVDCNPGNLDPLRYRRCDCVWPAALTHPTHGRSWRTSLTPTGLAGALGRGNSFILLFVRSPKLPRSFGVSRNSPATGSTPHGQENRFVSARHSLGLGGLAATAQSARVWGWAKPWSAPGSFMLITFAGEADAQGQIAEAAILEDQGGPHRPALYRDGYDRLGLISLFSPI
jgi:hypothetical protein